MHLLHSWLYFPVGLYFMAWKIFNCLGEIPNKIIPLVADLPVKAFAVQRSVRAVAWADNMIHLDGVTPTV